MSLHAVSDTELSPEELQRHILSTYMEIRVAIGIIGITFPFVLWIGGMVYAGLPLQNSMSHYYLAVGVDGRSMRDWFVGMLFFLGICLFLYKGFGSAENWALNVAGVMAVAVAVFPESPSRHWITPHGCCAVVLFASIAFVALFCSETTLNLIYDTNIRNPEKAIARLKLIYRVIGWVIVSAMIVEYLLNTAFRAQDGTFWVEAAGILPFGTYWLVKSWELRRTAAELKTVRCETRKTGGKVIAIDRH